MTSSGVGWFPFSTTVPPSAASPRRGDSVRGSPCDETARLRFTSLRPPPAATPPDLHVFGRPPADPSDPSASPVADGRLPPFQHDRNFPAASRQREHLLQRGGVSLHVAVLHRCACLLVVPTSVGGVRSRVLAEDDDDARHVPPPLSAGVEDFGLAGGFHSATLATFARSLRFRSTQSLPRSIRRCVEPPAAPYVYAPAEPPPEGGRSEVKRSRAGSSHGEPRTEPRPPRRRSRTIPLRATSVRYSRYVAVLMKCRT